MMVEESEDSSEAEEMDPDNMFKKELRKTFTIRPCGEDHLGLYRALARGVKEKKTIPNAEHVMCNIGIHLMQNRNQFEQLLSRHKTTFDDELRKSQAFLKLHGGEFQIHVASSLFKRHIIVIEPDFRIKQFGQEFASSRPIYLCIENGSDVGFLRPRRKGTNPMEILSLLSSIPHCQRMEPVTKSARKENAGLKRKKGPSKVSQRKKRQKVTENETPPFIKADIMQTKPNTRPNQGEQSQSCNHQKPDNDGAATCCTSKKVPKPAPPDRRIVTRQDTKNGRSDAQVVKPCLNPLKLLLKMYPPRSKYKHLWTCLNCGKVMPKCNEKKHLESNGCSRSTIIIIPQKVVQPYLKVINTKDGKKFKCTSCNTLYSSAKNHRIHVRIIHEKQYAPYKCESCDQAFIKKCKYVQHTNSNACQKKQVIKKIAEDYMVEVTSGDKGTIRYQCKKCYKDFASPRGLRTHVELGRCNQTPASRAVVKKEIVSKKQCEKCKEYFSSQKTLDLHLKSKTNICERNIENQRLMEEYGRKVIREGKENFLCIKCNHTYTSMSNWKMHVLKEHRDGNLSKLQNNESGNNSLDATAGKELKFKQPGKFVCKKCGYSFSSNFELQRHVNSTTGICDKVFKYKDFLQQCVRVETNGEGESKIVLQCYKCNRPFKTTDELRRHARDSSCSNVAALGEDNNGKKGNNKQTKRQFRDGELKKSKTKWKCGGCGTSFARKSNLKNHSKNKSSCERVQRLNEFLQTYVEEVLSECNELKYRCRVCQRTFLTIENLKRHLTRNTSKPINSNLNQSGSISTFNYTCNEGRRKSAEFVEKYVIQEIRRTNEVITKCRLCNKAFSTIKNVIRHIKLRMCKTLHDPAVKRPTRKSSKPKICKCDICGTTFTALSSLLKHQKNQDCSNFYPCKYCHNQFFTKNALKIHKCPFDPKTKRYTCEFCGELFTSKLKFDEHINWHKQKRDLVCDRCGAMFSRRNDLFNHMHKRHGKERKCDLCGKVVPSYLAGGVLLNHSRECYKQLCLGNLEKGPYDMVKCSTCEEKKVAFDYYSHMHWEVITSNKLHVRLPFPCSKCACAFQTKTTLAIHEHIHVPVEVIQQRSKEINCEYCGKVFAYVRNLTNHLKYCKKRKEEIRMEEMISMLAKTFPMPTERLYHCCRCNETADSREDMMEHCSKAHAIRVPNDFNDVVPRIKTQMSDCGLYSCYVCNQRFLCYVAQRMHTRICEERFGTKIPQGDSP